MFRTVPHSIVRSFSL